MYLSTGLNIGTWSQILNKINHTDRTPSLSTSPSADWTSVTGSDRSRRTMRGWKFQIAYFHPDCRRHSLESYGPSDRPQFFLHVSSRLVSVSGLSSRSPVLGLVSARSPVSGLVSVQSPVSGLVSVQSPVSGLVTCLRTGLCPVYLRNDQSRPVSSAL